MRRVGVLALQGAFVEHITVLYRLGVEGREVRLPKDLEGIDGLIIPGGESTTIANLMGRNRLLGPIKDLARQGLPVWGTCAGMILLANRVIGLDLPNLGLMAMEVRRNAFGRQVDSFEVDLPIAALGEETFHAVFIRAPVIQSVAPEVEALARLSDGRIVAARQDKLIATAFHPELTQDPRFHRYFLDLG